MPALDYIPWRSVWLPRAIAAVALVIGVPLFLRSPPWCDLTLYMLAARNLLHDGIHYRDLFDTNLPGFVWITTALYSVFGPNVIVFRLLDLAVVLGVALLIDRLAKWGGATQATKWWAFAAVALFYPFTGEMCHAQRDVWMALPALAAVTLRVRRGLAGGKTDTRDFVKSLYEGLLWGAAVWMKPHVVPVALVVWILSAWRLTTDAPRPWRAVVIDLLGNLCGGLLVGLAGVCWLFGSGAWNDFREVFTVWNPHYVKLTQIEFDSRVKEELHWFAPWSLGLVLTVPLAVLSVLDAAPWSRRTSAEADLGAPGWLGRWLPWWLWDRQAGTDARFARGVMGGVYLAWATQAFFVQRGFHYVHVPETLLMFGVWASHRWAWAFMSFVWLVLTSGLWIASDCNPTLQEGLSQVSAKTRERYLPRHLATDPERLKLWPACWRLNVPDSERYALWDALRLHPPHEASIGWVELAELAEFFRSQGVQDGEVIGWFNSPHAVCLLLDVKPGFRYMHVYTAIAIDYDDASNKIGRNKVMQELREAPQAKYVISDLRWVILAAGNGKQADYLGPPRNPPQDLLPVNSPCAREFPFNQPTLFRTRNGNGRYIVHKIVTCKDDW